MNIRYQTSFPSLHAVLLLKFWPFFITHTDPQFLVAWIIGGACALVALIICFHHLWLFSRMEKSNLRSSYIGVVLMAPVRWVYLRAGPSFFTFAGETPGSAN